MSKNEWKQKKRQKADNRGPQSRTMKTMQEGRRRPKDHWEESLGGQGSAGIRHAEAVVTGGPGQ